MQFRPEFCCTMDQSTLYIRTLPVTPSRKLPLCLKLHSTQHCGLVPQEWLLQDIGHNLSSLIKRKPCTNLLDLVNYSHVWAFFDPETRFDGQESLLFFFICKNNAGLPVDCLQKLHFCQTLPKCVTLTRSLALLDKSRESQFRMTFTENWRQRFVYSE